MRGAPLTAALCVAATLLMAACGSTADPSSRGADNLSAGNGLSPSAGSADAGAAQASAGQATGGFGSATAGGAAPAAAGSAGSGGTPATDATARSAAGPAGGAIAAPQGPGVTGTQIVIGFTYTENADKANAALGLDEITSGDQKANANAIVADVNAHGGVAGRKLVPEFYAYDANSQDTRASQDQAACAHFTEDKRVYAVVAVGFTESFTACLRKHNVMQIAAGVLIDPDRSLFDRWPNYINATTMTQDRMMGDMAQTLQRMSYFTGWDSSQAAPGPLPVKIGIMAFDDPGWKTPLNKVMLPTLARLGHPVDPSNVVLVHVPASTAENGESANQISGAVLKFRSAGVTHVIMLDSNGGLTLLFSGPAKGQNYYPRLGINSGTGMEGLYEAGAFDKKMLSGAVGLGWAPSIDLPAAAGDTYATAATKYCLKVIKERTGQTFTSTNAASIALSNCDGIYLAARAIRGAGTTIDLRSGVAAVERIGDTFGSASIPAAFFGPGRHDGAQIGYDLAWDGACPCAVYRGKGHRIP